MMQGAELERRQAFGAWLRTGRWPTVRTADGIELKFNPNHNPDNGRFTTSDGGQRWGNGGFTGGGGGSGGGGGATGGGWPDRPTSRPARPPTRHQPAAPRSASVAPAAPLQPAAKAAEKPYRHVLRNGYAYDIDASDRTVRVTGELTVGDGGRSRAAQAQAGGADRLSTDDGGHYVAARFNGPTDAFNHFAQDRSVNRGRYRRLEDQWARAKRAGHRVRVKIAPIYERSSRRPSMIDVWFTIDGNRQSDKFPNSTEATKHAK